MNSNEQLWNKTIKSRKISKQIDQEAKIKKKTKENRKKIKGKMLPLKNLATIPGKTGLPDQ